MNYLDLINIKYKLFIKVIILVLLFLGGIIYILNKSYYDVFNTYGYILDEKLVLNIPVDNPDIIENMEYCKINDKEKIITIDSISDILLDSDNLINYQEIIFNVDNSYYEKEVLKITIYYNKEKVITKIKNIIF